MTRALAGLIGLVIIAAMSGCGQDRATLARHAVQTYWYDVGHAKLRAAYGMLTSGNQQSEPFKTYDGNILGLLGSTASLHATVGKPTVNGDTATVPVTLHSIRTAKPLAAYQHLYWENGGWRIADQNGGVSHTP